jgi:hypothetical protein
MKGEEQETLLMHRVFIYLLWLTILKGGADPPLPPSVNKSLPLTVKTAPGMYSPFSQTKINIYHTRSRRTP